MKRLLEIMVIAALAVGSCLAVDYDKGQMFNVRVYRVSLGSGTAPSAADMATLRLHNGDEVLNTDDNVLYIMNATNVYVKISAAGAVTIQGMTLNSNTVTNTVSAGSVLPAADGGSLTNMSAAQLKAGTVLNAVDGSALTNISAAQLTAGTAISAVNGTAITNIADAALAGTNGKKLMANNGVSLTNIPSTSITGGSTYTNAATGFTNVFINGILTSHTP